MEADRIIIGSYTQKDDHVVNLLFGGPTRKYTYNVYAYHVLYFNGEAGLSIKRINGINRLWRLEQVFRKHYPEANYSQF